VVGDARRKRRSATLPLTAGLAISAWGPPTGHNATSRAFRERYGSAGSRDLLLEGAEMLRRSIAHACHVGLQTQPPQTAMMAEHIARWLSNSSADSLSGPTLASSALRPGCSTSPHPSPWPRPPWQPLLCSIPYGCGSSASSIDASTVGAMTPRRPLPPSPHACGMLSTWSQCEPSCSKLSTGLLNLLTLLCGSSERSKVALLGLGTRVRWPRRHGAASWVRRVLPLSGEVPRRTGSPPQPHTASRPP